MAQEYVATKGPLSDDDFYRLVTCAAPIGAECQKPTIRWSRRKAQRLTLGITRIDPGFPPAKAARIKTALTDAITELNQSGARISLSQTQDAPLIPILLLDMPRFGVIDGSGVPGLDGNRIQAAHVHLWWNNRRRIQRGAIVMSRDMREVAIGSTMLEEITQSLGFLTDIQSVYYRDRSIFSEGGFTRTTLGPQDKMVLMRHYAQ